MVVRSDLTEVTPLVALSRLEAKTKPTTAARATKMMPVLLLSPFSRLLFWMQSKENEA